MGIESSDKHMAMWNHLKNPSEPEGIGFYNQSKKYWWKCSCGNEWQSYVVSITRRIHVGCRECIRKIHGFIDFTGQTIGEWHVIKKIKNDKRHGSLWLAKCLGCENEHEVRGDNLRAGMTKKCLSCHIEEMSMNQPIAPSHWSKIKSGALARGISFEITMEEAHDLFLIQNGKCALTGDALHLYSRTKMHEHLSPKLDNYASLDRIDSNKGYFTNNLQWIRKDINLLKMAFSQDHFIRMCQKVSSYNSKEWIADRVAKSAKKIGISMAICPMGFDPV